MIAALARVPGARLARTPRAWLPLLVWLATGLAMAVLARTQGSPNGANHVLLGVFGALVVPLLAYAAVAGSLGGVSLSASVAPAVAFGAAPSRVAAVTVAVAALLAALLSAGLGATVAIVAHGVDDPPAAHDAWLSAYAGALGGAAYAALFSFGASFGKRGGGRAVLLVLDWALGSNRSAASLLTPRGHLRNLLGGEAPFGLSERASAAALLAILVMCTLLSVRRVRQT